MKMIIKRLGLLMLGAVISGCGVIYFPQDRGLHRGEYERDRGRVMQKGPERGDYDRGRARDREQERRGDRDQRN